MLIVEVASSNERREAMSERVRAYLDWAWKRSGSSIP